MGEETEIPKGKLAHQTVSARLTLVDLILLGAQLNVQVIEFLVVRLLQPADLQFPCGLLIRTEFGGLSVDLVDGERSCSRHTALTGR